MNQKRFFFFLFLCLILTLPMTRTWAETVVIDSQKQFQLASEAMAKGEYQQAVYEFKRFLFFFPSDPETAKVYYLIGKCYLLEKNFAAARESLDQTYQTYTDSAVGGQALLLIGESYFQQGISKEAIYYFEKTIQEYAQPEIKNAAIYKLGWARMQAGQWQEASQTFQQVESGSPLFSSSQNLVRESLKAADLPSKNPTTAGVLAAVVPGLGHVYCNRYKDGLVAFALNGLFIYAAYEAFDHDQDTLGGMLCFLELGWYSGNIYSATNSAHKYNRAVRNEYRKNLYKQFNVNVFASPQGQMGLAFKIEF
jgi:TolA-binding protein